MTDVSGRLPHRGKTFRTQQTLMDSINSSVLQLHLAAQTLVPEKKRGR